ncbi:MAG: hypothetical protein Alpg2KO_06130 [Alphaproteobacteria bacterium]
MSFNLYRILIGACMVVFSLVATVSANAQVQEDALPEQPPFGRIVPFDSHALRLLIPGSEIATKHFPWVSTFEKSGGWRSSGGRHGEYGIYRIRGDSVCVDVTSTSNKRAFCFVLYMGPDRQVYRQIVNQVNDASTMDRARDALVPVMIKQTSE